MDQTHIKEAQQRALELLPQMKAAAAKEGNDNRFTVTWRYMQSVGSVAHARPAFEKIYGKAYEYNLHTSGDPDGLGDLQMQKEVAVTAHFFLSNVIKHLEAQSEDVVLNKHDEPATHQDCLEYGSDECSGAMSFSENINTGRSFLRCAKHGDRAAAEQDRIHREYLNDTVPEDAQ